MGTCEICGQYANVNTVGVCNKCFWTKPETNRFGEPIDWEHQYNINRKE